MFFSYTLDVIMNKDSFKDGEPATATKTANVEYGDDPSIIRKLVYVSKNFAQSGNLILTETTTCEYDEDGLQTGLTIEDVSADGTEDSSSIEFVWTKDSDGKAISYQAVKTFADGEESMTTGDVEVNEEGLITKIDNVKVDGEDYSTTVDITYQKFDNPTLNVYESWKNFTISELIIPII